LIAVGDAGMNLLDSLSWMVFFLGNNRDTRDYIADSNEEYMKLAEMNEDIERGIAINVFINS
jgi:hypothetical protein